MVAVTYGVARLAADAGARAATQKGWFVRFMDALAATRMEQARREIRIHTGLLPYTLDERGNRLVKTGASEMPFGL
jgi:hypothetical protein